MPSPPVPFITHSGLVTLRHDLKTRINSSPLVKVPLTMRPLVKKRSSNPFGLTLKRHSTTIFSRSSSSSCASSSPGCTPSSEMTDPLSMADMAIDLPSQTPPHNIPSIGTKILEKFWPEDEGIFPEESRSVSALSRYPTVLAPPPHHRRVPRSLGSIHDLPLSDPIPPRKSDEDDTTPLRFPF